MYAEIQKIESAARIAMGHFEDVELVDGRSRYASVTSLLITAVLSAALVLAIS